MVLYVDIGNKILTKSDGLNRLALPDHPQVFEGSQEMFEITFYKDGADIQSTQQTHSPRRLIIISSILMISWRPLPRLRL